MSKPNNKETINDLRHEITLLRQMGKRIQDERNKFAHLLSCFRELHGDEAWETLSVYAEQVRNEASMYEYQPGIGKTAFVEPRTKSEVLRDYGKNTITGKLHRWGKP